MFPVQGATFAECDKRNMQLYKSALELWDDVEKNNNDPQVIDYYASLSKIPQFRPGNAPVKRSKTLWGLKFKPKGSFLTGSRMKNQWHLSSQQNLSHSNSMKMVQRPKEPPPLPPLPPPLRQDFQAFDKIIC